MVHIPLTCGTGWGFTIKRAQIRTYIAKMGGHCISSTSEISKYRRTWPLAVLRHIPIALGTSGALGVGWETPQSIEVGYAPAGIILRPPRRYSMRQYRAMWGGNFAFLRRNRSKTKHACSGGGKGWFWHGKGCFCSVFARASPTPAVLWTFPRTFPEDVIFAKHGGEVSMDEGWAKQWWWW
jgi:hypothetical protein